MKIITACAMIIKNLVIYNHFGIVRLKTQTEKYMALKDEISKLVFLLKIVIISS